MDPEVAPPPTLEGADPTEGATEERQADDAGMAPGDDYVEPGAGADTEAEPEAAEPEAAEPEPEAAEPEAAEPEAAEPEPEAAEPEAAEPEAAEPEPEAAEPEAAEPEAAEDAGAGDDSYADDAFHEHDEAADDTEAAEPAAAEPEPEPEPEPEAEAEAEAEAGNTEPRGVGEEPTADAAEGPEGGGEEEVPEHSGKILTYISPSFERAASAVYRIQADPEQLAAAKEAVLASIASAAPSRNASSVARASSGSASGSASGAAAATAASGAASKRESFSSQTASASAAAAPPAVSESAPGPGSTAGSKPASKAGSFSSSAAPPALEPSASAGTGASRGASFSSAAPAAAPEASAVSAASSSLRKQQSGGSAAAATDRPQASAPSASGAPSGAASRATSFVGAGQLSQSQSQSQSQRQGSRPGSTEPLEPSAPSTSSAAAQPPLLPRGLSFASNTSGPVRRAPSTSTSSSAGQPVAEPSLAPAALPSSSLATAVAAAPPPPLPPLPSSAAGSRPRSAASAAASASSPAATSDPAAPASPPPPPEPSSPPPPPPPPHHLSTTRVQPKGPLDACAAQSASEHVRTVWSTANICGIRSLPNALNPDFRERLYQELVAAAQRERAGDTSGDRGRRADLSYGLEGGPLAMPLSVGQKQVARIHPLSGMFTQFEYLPSEYDRVKLMGKFDRLKHKLSQTTPSEFVVRAPPAPPRGAPAFSEFAYVTDPAEAYDSSVLADNDVGRSRVVAGPFYPAGRPKSATSLKGRLDECMMGLCRQLSEDWPTGFLQIFEDSNGSVVVSFDKSRAVSEGDLTSYMNTLAKRHHLVAAFHLLKDATQWGLVDADTGAVFYVLWPPWVRHKYLGPHAAAAFGEAANGRPGTRGSDSSDEEGGGGGGGGSGGAYDGEEGPRSGGGLLESYGDGASMGLGSTATGMGGDGYGRMGSAMRAG
ncbi:hypothetical protein CHLRE_06g308650v5 [Chlamydomonas reinhardtii]|uniref:Uncharacterized protein n=1 Tax=Chlamydomonas reinhardtii TaxID=3055 RepID=A0A2K3DRI4_CHLRE|nr:uncharacterized protein CHLRE_06g308650v5 [Chlamydomonas reinhardtii]PNW83149.1 hypothetical protein CHLRE_06g308650v5 [Chlamydomonas reinhardtii]